MGSILKSTTIFSVIFFFLALSFSSCSRQGRARTVQRSQEIPVKATRAEQETIPDEINAIGNVEAYATVSVQSQVSGKLAKIYFKELLFLIDPQPFQIALDQSKANLNKDEAVIEQARAVLLKDMAQEKYASIEAQRYKKLLKENYVSAEQADETEANAASMKATVAADEAGVQTAKKAALADREAMNNAALNLGYCSIRSPITGRTGSILIKAGNLVNAQNSTLVTIARIQPIYVDFSVPEQDLPEIRKNMAEQRLPVQTVSQGSHEIENGFLAFVNNTVDPATGTIELKGIFDNKDKQLWPGEFVNANLILNRLSHATVVPSQAVQNGQIGTYVFVVKSNHTAEIRKITAGRTVQGISFDGMVNHQLKANAILLRDRSVFRFMSSVSGGNTGHIFIMLSPEDKRPSVDQVIQELRKKFSKLVGFQVFLQNLPPIRVGGKSTQSSYQYTLESPDTKTLYEDAAKLKSKMEELPMLQDVASDLYITSPQVNV